MALFVLILALAAAQVSMTAPTGGAGDALVIESIERGAPLSKRVAHFDLTVRQGDLRGRVLSCGNIVDLSTQSHPTLHAYGGICRIKFARHQRDYAICDDEDTADPSNDDGQATLSLSFTEERDWLVDFTRNNCMIQSTP
jgi:hypothetical protein